MCTVITAISTPLTSTTATDSSATSSTARRAKLAAEDKIRRQVESDPDTSTNGADVDYEPTADDDKRALETSGSSVRTPNIFLNRMDDLETPMDPEDQRRFEQVTMPKPGDTGSNTTHDTSTSAVTTKTDLPSSSDDEESSSESDSGVDGDQTTQNDE